MSRKYKISFKVTEDERKELNNLIEKEGKSISDILRIALKNTFKSINGFEASYEATANNSYHKNKKWRLY